MTRIPVTVKLHRPFESLVALVARIEFSVDVTAPDVGGERTFTGKLYVAEVAEKLVLSDRILDQASTEFVQVLALIRLKRRTKRIKTTGTTTKHILCTEN